MMISTSKLAIASGLSLLISGGSAMAASPVGQWNIKFFNEPGLTTGSTHGVCFKSDKTFYGTTVSWTGTWFQKGDRLRFSGETSGAEKTGNFGQFASNTLVAGEFQSRLGTSTFNSNWTLTKVGSTCAAPATKAAKASGSLTQ